MEFKIGKRIFKITFSVKIWRGEYCWRGHHKWTKWKPEKNGQTDGHGRKCKRCPDFQWKNKW